MISFFVCRRVDRYGLENIKIFQKNIKKFKIFEIKYLISIYFNY